ncbi:hypothetical protein [Rhizobium sp. P007]|uniref:hypothetical protein n=1 Tax=Rhizobium sp. P007 TaxID=285908 RepID=UPI0011588537|nr:hypothetical protein [Rhizobium sp. P007]
MPGKRSGDYFRRLLPIPETTEHFRAQIRDAFLLDMLRLKQSPPNARRNDRVLCRDASHQWQLSLVNILEIGKCINRPIKNWKLNFLPILPRFGLALGDWVMLAKFLLKSPELIQVFLLGGDAA